MQHSIAVGRNHALFIDSNQSVWLAGNCQYAHRTNYFGSDTNIKVDVRSPVCSVVTELDCSLLLDQDGFVWYCGSNPLEMEPTDQGGISLVKPQMILNIPIIQSISGGREHSLLLDIDGMVWAFGNNYYGQLGIETNDQNMVLKPMQLNLPQIIEIAAGYTHSLFLDIEGTVWSCGDNSSGALGRAVNTKSPKHAPAKLLKLPIITKISASSHSLLLDETGSAWSCGSNGCGQLGKGDIFFTFTKRMKKVNQLPETTWIQAGHESSLFIDVEGNAWACGRFGSYAFFSKVRKIQDLPKCRVVYATGEFALAIDEDGRLWGCGDNRDGQLGAYDKKARKDFTLIHSFPQLHHPVSTSVKSARKI